MSNIQLIATSPMGLEALVARELRDLGYQDLQVENGRVTFHADELAICRGNLWLRTADRILVKVGQCSAHSFDELFDGVYAMDWPSWIPADGLFPVEGRSHESVLTSVPATQGIVKKAIVEKLKQAYGVSWFEETGARYGVEVSLIDNIATLTIDTSGASLHKRGYRKLVAEAPLKETMAAAIVNLSRWRSGRPLYDPFCGSGTLLIEAAMIGWNIAPGQRRSFPSEAWARVSKEMWEQAREEAYDAVRDDVALDIVGSDIDPQAVEIAQACARAAGLGKHIDFRVEAVAKAKPRGDYGVLVTNPPYGERLGDQREADVALRELGSLAAQLPSWSLFVLTPNRQFESMVGRPADKRRKLYNGRIETHLIQYLGPLPPRN